jgi:hypothetical protein
MNKLLFSAQIFFGVFLLPTTLCSQTPSAKSSEPIYIGVLDDAREEMVNWKPGVAGQRVIRPVFEKSADEWKSMDASSLPAHMKWTIVFDARNLGTLESEASSGKGLTSFQTVLTSASSIPTIGSPSQQFAGIMAYGPGKMRRPLVVVSEPYFRDPDGWKRTKLPDEISSSVLKAFRHDYPRVDRCKDETIVEHNWKFPDQALAFPAAYGSNKRSFLAQAHLDTGDCGWVDADDDPQSDPWFFVSEDGTVHRIGSFMTLLDAGDYDNDGRSEVIFFLSQGENTDGFVLFDASFKKHVSLFWNYH